MPLNYKQMHKHLLGEFYASAAMRSVYSTAASWLDYELNEVALYRVRTKHSLISYIQHEMLL